jgi:hypothetical protein
MSHQSETFFSSNDSFNILDATFSDITHETIVDPREASILLEIPKRDSAHAIAGNMLKNAIFSEDLQVKILNSDLKKHDEIKDLELYFGVYFNTLGKSFEKDRCSLGYTCWTYTETLDERFAEKPITIPIHVHRSRYDITVKTHKDERVEYIVCRKGSKTQMERYHLFIWAGMEPDPMTGKHNSIVTPLVEEHFRLERLKQLDDRSNYHRSHPVYVLEPASEGNSSGSNKSEIFTFNATPFSASNQETQQQEKLKMAVNEATLAKSLQQPNLILRQSDGQRVPLYGPGGEENRIFLPHGYKASSSQPPFPEAPSDLLERILTYQKLVFANYGIPFSLALGDGKTSASSGSKQTANLGGEKDFEMFQRSLLQVIHTLEFIYGEVWHHLYPGKSNRKDAKFYVRIIPITSTGSIHTLYNQGVMHKESRNKRLAQLHGLSEDDLATEENIITRPPLTGTEHHTTSEMKAREELIKAETKERLAKAESLKNSGQDSKNEKELIEMNMEFEREKHKLQLEMLKAKLDFEREKMQIEKEKLPLEKEKAELQMSLMKKKQKTQQQQS